MIASTVIIFALILTAHCGPATQKFHQTNTIERAEDGAIIGRHHSSSEEGHDTEFDHEAILGSVKDAEEFHNLNPEESKRRLGQLVKQMDLNQDGNIDRKELKAWIIRSFKSLSQEEADERFDDCDENEDGRVTWEEYLEDSYGFKSECIGPSMEPAIYTGDVLLVEHISPSLGRFDRGDIIILKNPTDPNQLLCKRLVGLPGDPIPNNFFDIRSKTVPRGHVWVKGDNTSNSSDSRNFGAVPQGLVSGRAIMKVWPLSEAGLIAER